MLVDKCYSCHSHSAKEVEGSLLLDSREGVRHGGDSGPAIVPGNPEKSLLIKAIRYKDADRQMPPRDAGGKLPDAVVRDFETWIKMGGQILAWMPRNLPLQVRQPRLATGGHSSP